MRFLLLHLLAGLWFLFYWFVCVEEAKHLGQLINIYCSEEGAVIIFKLLLTFLNEFFTSVSEQLAGRESRKVIFPFTFLAIFVDISHSTVSLFESPGLPILCSYHLNHLLITCTEYHTVPLSLYALVNFTRYFGSFIISNYQKINALQDKSKQIIKEIDQSYLL